MGRYRHFYTDLNIVHTIGYRLYFPDDCELSFGIQSLSNPEEMPNHAAFNLGYHYLPKYPYSEFQYESGNMLKK